MVALARGYYAQENARHGGALQTRITAERAIRLVEDLCNVKGLPMVRVIFHRRRGVGKGATSWFRPQHIKNHEVVVDTISIEEGMLNHLVVVHEWAHYAHYVDYRRRREKESYPHRWHGPEHRLLVDEGVEWCRRQGIIVEAVPTSVPQAVVKTQATVSLDRDILQMAVDALAGRDIATLTKEEYRAIVKGIAAVYFKSLPETMVCPRCLRVLPREQFGSRILKKTPAGIPKLIGRQSNCHSCRRAT